MWNLIIREEIPLNGQFRYCCRYLKEIGGKGRFVVTGIRWAESPKRKVLRKMVEYKTDNKKILNPIIDWSDEDVWNYIHNNNVSYEIIWIWGDYSITIADEETAKSAAIYYQPEPMDKFTIKDMVNKALPMTGSDNDNLF